MSITEAYSSDKPSVDLDSLLSRNSKGSTGSSLLELHKQLCQEAYLIVQRKNKDYGASNEDSLANFRICKHVLKIAPELGVLLRVIDKISRICTWVSSGDFRVKGETWRDSVIDIINYMVFIAAFLTEREREAK